MAEQSAGLMESLKRLVSTLTSIVSTRLELLANELQEERLRLTQMLVFALICAVLFRHEHIAVHGIYRGAVLG